MTMTRATWSPERRARYVATMSVRKTETVDCPTCGTTFSYKGSFKHIYRCAEFQCEVDGCEVKKSQSPTLCRAHLILDRRARTMGATVHDVVRVFAAQNGACGACQTPLTLASLSKNEAAHLDHDHARNLFRGILCHPCNAAIGLMKDNPDRLRQAAAYLERS